MPIRPVPVLRRNSPIEAAAWSLVEGSLVEGTLIEGTLIEGTLIEGSSPLVAAAIHDGAMLRRDVAPWMALGPEERRREEDPCTGEWTSVAPTRLIGCRSRFEVDLNRPRDKAVYLTPEDAWGLEVWREPLPREVIEGSLATYDAFYASVGALLDRLVAQFGRVVVYDLHSYNHRRGGPLAPPDSPEANPEVNLGTGTMDRSYWSPVVDRFLHDLSSTVTARGRLDVRENVRFRGGHFGRWIHTRYPKQVCVLSIEFKKFYMDEWSGEIDAAEVSAVREALAATTRGVLEAVSRL